MREARRGRPGKGLAHVDQLEGSEHSKERLRMILGTLSGSISVREAATGLGLSESRFAEIRKTALQSAIEGLEPRPVGRPRNAPSAPSPEDLERERLQTAERMLQARELLDEVRAVVEEHHPPDRTTSARQSEPVPSKEAGKKGLHS